jgi:hypothetical protein
MNSLVLKYLIFNRLQFDSMHPLRGGAAGGNLPTLRGPGVMLQVHPGKVFVRAKMAGE